MILRKVAIAILTLPIMQVMQDLRGTIQGRVLTAAGAPASEFAVFIRGLYEPATLKTWIRTDRNGNYVAANLRPGQYALYTYGESEWYPLRNGSFMQDAPDARAVLESGQSVTRNLVLPEPAALIRGTVFNGDGSPLPNVKVVLCHMNSVDRAVDLLTTKDGVFTSYVPSGQPLSALVVAPSGVAVQITGLVLKAEEKRTISLGLKNKTSIDGKRCIPVVAQ